MLDLPAKRNEGEISVSDTDFERRMLRSERDEKLSDESSFSAVSSETALRIRFGELDYCVNDFFFGLRLSCCTLSCAALAVASFVPGLSPSFI